MFLDKVGSDACLVLTAIHDSVNNIITIEQDFDLKDLIKASETRVVVVKTYSDIEPDAAIITYLASYGTTGFIVLGIGLDLGFSILVFEKKF